MGNPDPADPGPVVYPVNTLMSGAGSTQYQVEIVPNRHFSGDGMFRVWWNAFVGDFGPSGLTAMSVTVSAQHGLAPRSATLNHTHTWQACDPCLPGTGLVG